jgi:uncharacterized protein involved in response to NO
LRPDGAPTLIFIKMNHIYKIYLAPMNPIPRIPRGYCGPTLFSYGFRPFFLAGSAWAALSILVWVPQIFGELTLTTAFAPRDWHIHEMLYGYLPAVIAGFLLTAIPNWTGRLPVAGLPLAILFSLWLAGRAAMVLSALTGPLVAAIVDLSFLVVLAAIALREIIAGRNWRNLRVLGILTVLIIGNAVFHIEAAGEGVADYGVRIGIAAAIGLIMLVGGRIVPSFTHNYLLRQAPVREAPGRLPQSFSRFDAICMVIGAVALAAWIAEPAQPVTGVLLLIAGILHIARLARWAGDRTVGDRLVLALHLGYSFVPLGFLLTAVSSLRPDLLPASAGAHAWTVGAVGMMTLAVMTRATLGHTGHTLAASRGTEAIYACVIVAAIARVSASLGHTELLLHVAGLAWIAAFLGFVWLYGPMLARASRASKRGS